MKMVTMKDYDNTKQATGSCEAHHLRVASYASASSFLAVHHMTPLSPIQTGKDPRRICYNRFVLKFEKQGDDRGMDSILSLGASFKHLSSTTKTSSPKTGAQGRRSSFTRRASISRRRSLPCSSQKVPDSWLRVYQAELKRERKRQQATLAKKNAERSVRKTHFRSHHCLPRQRSAARKAEAAAKKDDSLFGAFQGLSLDGVLGAINGPPAAAAGGGGDPCKVM
ncbi:uncharacterized protein si:ch211-81a5.8 isoform X1 [Dunckerocampus dactyliophorus]|uniref:uncharacterized protein si:ch211-81a5.8 isoform X1 n=1 Tax=Dunckerocampus dactyliophorus TaxID=161453 RepID=UPI0024059064|nr:uncharacterized protein si:ch211-81a5.8 isoform X1 [Dunckerocampus dactyliophorus]